MVTFVVLLLAEALVVSVVATRWAGPRADRRMAEVYASTGVPLDGAATARLRPVVLRRTSWPAVGRSIGVLVALGCFLLLSGPADHGSFLRTTLLAGLAGATVTALGLAAGGLVGHVAAGYRGFPPGPSAVRAVRLSPRRTSDHVGAARLRAARWSTIALAVTVAVDLLVLQRSSAGVAVLAAGLAALGLAALSWAVSRVLLGRPVAAEGSDELRWREAFLSDTLQLVAAATVQLNVCAVLLGLGAVLALRGGLAA